MRVFITGGGFGFLATFMSLVPSYRGLFLIRGLQMQHNYEERYYSPQFSEMSSVSVRRLAWALDVSMVKAVEELINFLPQLLSVQAVCSCPVFYK